MLAHVGNLLANPPVRIAYSLSLVAKGGALVAGACGATALAFGALGVLDRFAPMVLSGHSGDVTVTVTGQLQTLALVSVRLNEFAQNVFAYFTS